jgi:hypothetical protein
MGNCTEGSNPSLSAKAALAAFFCELLFRRDARAVEWDGLAHRVKKNHCMGNCTEGSPKDPAENPSPCQ